MKNMLKIFVLVACAIGGAATAHAQGYPQQQMPVQQVQQMPVQQAPMQFIDPDCGALGNSPFVCVVNRTSSPIVSLTCSGVFGSWNLLSPGSFIAPGQTTIINFAKGVCNFSVTAVTTAGPHQMPAFDYHRATKLFIQGW